MLQFLENLTLFLLENSWKGEQWFDVICNFQSLLQKTALCSPAIYNFYSELLQKSEALKGAAIQEVWNSSLCFNKIHSAHPNMSKNKYLPHHTAHIQGRLLEGWELSFSTGAKLCFLQLSEMPAARARIYNRGRLLSPFTPEGSAKK